MKTIILGSLMALTSFSSFAFNDEVREAMTACLKENNIAAPAKGTRPAVTDRQIIDACMKTKGFEPPTRRGNDGHREAFKACLTENNIAKPERGTPPSDADRQVIDACMKTKGFELPPRRGPGSRHSSEE